jgi:hypothetical protein
MRWRDPFAGEESELWTIVKIEYKDIADEQNVLRSSVVKALAYDLYRRGYGKLFSGLAGVFRSQGAFIVDVMRAAAQSRYDLKP